MMRAWEPNDEGMGTKLWGCGNQIMGVWELNDGDLEANYRGMGTK